MPRTVSGFASPLIVIIVVILSMVVIAWYMVHLGRSVNGWWVVVLRLLVMRLLLNDRDVKLVDHRSIVGVATTTKSTTTTACSSSTTSAASIAGVAAVEQNLVFR